MEAADRIMLASADPTVRDPVLAEPIEQRVETIIEPARGWIGVNWTELSRYRELLAFLVWRDVRVKYKQAVLGVAWAIILPIISLCIYGGVAAAFDFKDALVGTPKPPVFLWMFAGLLPWMFLQRAISDGGMSLLNNQPLMTKVYLPRLFLPLAALGNALVDTLIHIGLLSIIGVYFYVRGLWVPTWQIVFILPLFVLLWVAAMGLSFLLSAATVLYRDLRFLIPFFVQFGLWLSCVPYPLAKFHGRLYYMYAVNPLTGIISGFRSAITGQPWDFVHLGSSIVLCTLMLVFGLFYFKRVERLFADIA